MYSVKIQDAEIALEVSGMTYGQLKHDDLLVRDLVSNARVLDGIVALKEITLVVVVGLPDHYDFTVKSADARTWKQRFHIPATGEPRSNVTVVDFWAVREIKAGRVSRDEFVSVVQKHRPSSIKIEWTVP